MAASVLLIVGPRDGERQRLLLQKVIEKAAKIEPGTGPGQMGPVIDARSLEKIRGYVAQSEKEGAEILLDGRSWTNRMVHTGGNWIGPTIVLHENRMDAAITRRSSARC